MKGLTTHESFINASRYCHSGFPTRPMVVTQRRFAQTSRTGLVRTGILLKLRLFQKIGERVNARTSPNHL